MTIVFRGGSQAVKASFLASNVRAFGLEGERAVSLEAEWRPL